jgi:hypothetical protein
MQNSGLKLQPRNDATQLDRRFAIGSAANPITSCLMRPPLLIRRRLMLLAAISTAGAILFLPLLAAGSHQPMTGVAGFAVVISTVAILVAWPGLRCADLTGLPMPLLRRLDGIRSRTSPRALVVSTMWGTALGAIGVIALRAVHAPPFPGGVLVRILSVVCVAATLEIILHLGVMSIVIWLARGRRWFGILAAAVAFVLLQSTGGALNHPLPVILASTVVNAATGVVVGWLYAADGLEYAAVCRALAYLIPVLAI